MKSFLLVLLMVLFFFSSTIYTAPLKFVPQILKQPNGEIINCFASGDEYFNWLHDKDGYTIVQDVKGYYVYAEKINGELRPTSNIVARTNPADLGIEKWIKPDENKIIERVQSLKMAKYSLNKVSGDNKIFYAPTKGKINNLVIFIRFADEEEFTEPLSTFSTMFNNTQPNSSSVYNYYNEVSYGQLEIVSEFFPLSNNNLIRSYRDHYPRNYYKVYSPSNTLGYQNSFESSEREHELLKNAIDFIKSSIQNPDDFDSDNDNFIDNICFIAKGSPECWGELLWPHMWTMESKNVFIGEKKVASYNFQLEKELSVGVLCHEMFHSLGAPDLYRYNGFELPVGPWDLMGIQFDTPQHMGTYMKFKYGKWIDEITEINNPGTYSLQPLSSSQNNCYKIKSPNSTTEYYVLEYRASNTLFENSVLGKGLLIYRINSSVEGLGNASGPPDEVYIYRPFGSINSDGTIRFANFNHGNGRTTINDTTTPSGFLSQGQLGLIDISDIGNAGSTISFKLNNFPAKSLYIEYPNNPVKVKIGSILNINWKSHNVAKVNIEYTTDGLNWNPIQNEINSRSDIINAYSWSVPNTPSNQCKIRIKDYYNPELLAISRNDFSIMVEDPPSITVVYPNGGELWEVQNQQSITWDSKFVSSVNIELSTDNGSSWTILKEKLSANDKIFTFEAPGYISNLCKIKITDADFIGTYDESDQPFSILIPPSPSITLITPSGGEQFEVGSYQKITWQNLSCIKIKIDYSIDGGINWNLLAAYLDADKGEYGWIIPDAISDNCKIRLTDLDYNFSVVNEFSFSFITRLTDSFWEKLNMIPGGGKVEAMIINNRNELIAGCYKSCDDGNSWSKMNFGSDMVNQVCALAKNKINGYLYACSEGVSGIFRSTDDGNNWIKLSDDIYMGTRAITVDDNGNIFIAELGGKIFKSTDHGLSFIQIGEIHEGNPWCIAINGNGDIFIGNLFRGLQTSRDGGKTWNSYWIDNLQNEVLSIIINRDGTIYAGGNLFNGVGMSTDNGVTWENKFKGFSCPQVAVTSLYIDNEGAIYAGLRYYGIYKSTDKGNNWISLNGPFSVQVFSILIDQHKSMYSATMQEINKSTYPWQSWIPVNKGIMSDGVYNLLIDKNNNIFAGSRKGIYFSSDKGGNWIDRNQSILSEVINSFETSKGTIIVSLNGGGSRRSTDKGLNWETINIGPFDGFFEVDECIYAAHPSYLWRSTDDGISWDYLFRTSDWKYPYAYYCRNVALNDSGYIYIGTYGGPGLLCSKDNGYSWEAINMFFESHIMDIKIDSAGSIYLGIEGTFQNQTVKGLYKSSDNAKSWELISTNNNVYQILFVNPHKTIFIKKSSDHFTGPGIIPMVITYSTNEGQSWHDISNNNISNQSISVFTTDNENYLWTATNEGIYRSYFPFTPDTIVGIETNQNFLQENFYLSQNYPNPFNPSTTISYSTPSSNFVKLTVYDILGNEIAILVNEEKPAGNYEINFNASGLSSGVYFYRIQAGSFTNTKKFILLR